MEPYEAAQTLEAGDAASFDEVKAAYKRAAVKYHPDKSSRSDAEARFKQVSEAYAVLGDYRENGGTFPVPRTARSAAVDWSVDGLGSFVAAALEIIPRLGPGLGALGSVIFEMLSTRRVSEKGIERIIEALFEGRRERRGASSPQQKSSRPPAGTLKVGPLTFQRYLRESDNGTQLAPLFGTMARPGLPLNVGTFWVQCVIDKMVLIDGRRYNLEITEPKAGPTVIGPGRRRGKLTEK